MTKKAKQEQKNLQNTKISYYAVIHDSVASLESVIYIYHLPYMAKGKTTYQAGRSPSGLQHYVYPVQKKNLPAGEKLKLMKYDKKLRKHVEHTFKDVK